jgi:hypothetical protein
MLNLREKKDDTLGLEVELNLEAAPTTVYALSLRQCRGGSGGFPRLQCAWGSDPFSGCWGLAVNLGSRATYRHCAVGAHFLEYRKNAFDQGMGDGLGPDDQVSGDQLQH